MALDYTGQGAARFAEPATMGWGAPVRIAPGDALRVRLRIARTSGADALISAGFLCYNDALALTGQLLTITPTVTSLGWSVYEADFTAWPAGTTQVYQVFQLHTAGAVVEVDEFSFLDVRAATEAAKVRAELTNAYRTTVDTDAAIAEQVTQMRTTIEDPAGTSLGATLALNYRTQVDTDSAISAAVTDMKAKIEDPAGASLGGTVSDIMALDLTALTGTAFGALMTQLEVDAGGTSAKISTHGTAISTLEGNASAGYLIKAQAGGAVSLLDLVAADGTAGTVSVAKLSADNIILDGSVLAKHIFVDSLSAISANMGTIQVGTANIADLAVETIKIKDQAVTTTTSAANAAVFDLRPYQTWVTTDSFSFAGLNGAAVLICMTAYIRVRSASLSDSFSGYLYWRVLFNGAVVLSGSISNDANAATVDRPARVWKATSGDGTQTVHLQAYSNDNGGAPHIAEISERVIYSLMCKK